MHRKELTEIDKVKDSRAYKYALWCSEPDNHYVGKYVKLQAELWLDIADGKNSEAYVCVKRWKKITKLLKLIMHPDLRCSMYEGLEDYAILFIYALFCTKCRSDDLRYYETGLLEIARKNFKTFTSAVIFIIGLLTEPQFSRFFSVAPDLSLSSELQVAIKKIIKSSPCLADEKIFKLLRKEVRCKLTESEYTPLAYSQDRMDGKLANMFLADECGAMDNYPIEAMRSSQIILREKLGIIISTQYQAYDIALKNHFLQVDEVREAEDYDAMGFNWLTMGLGDILLNPDTMEVFTPNTGQTSNLGDLSTEQRGNDKHDPKSGRFAPKNSSGSVDNSGKSDIIKSENLKMSAPLQKSPDFSKYEVKSDLKAVEAFKETVSAKLGIPISDISLDGIRNTEVLEPFINRIEQIQKETGMKMPALRSLSVIDGDETCIAGYKRYENTLYISSKYFNSKDALVDTLKEWANNGTLPKQGKTIRYLAEHETAHIRIPVSDIESEEGFEIFRKAMKRGLCENDKNIYEFYADCEALDRMGYSDKNIQDAVEYLKRRRKSNGFS